MGRYRPNKNSRRVSAARKQKDLDEIYNDMHDEKAMRNTKFKIDHTLPGLGQFYCVACARHFVDAAARDTHAKTQVHKRRVKTLEKEVPYTGDEHIKIDNGGPIQRTESAM